MRRFSRPFLVAFFFLAFSGVRAAASTEVEVCLEDIAREVPCVPKKVSCEKPKSPKPNGSTVYLGYEDFVPLDKVESEGTGVIDFPMYHFASSNDRKEALHSSNYATCSAVSFVNPNCGYASLSHIVATNPEKVITTLSKDFHQNLPCVLVKDQTEIYMMLSVVVGLQQSFDSYVYRGLICEARQRFPHAKIHVIHSKKLRGEGDQIRLTPSGDGFLFRLESDDLSHTRSNRTFRIYPKNPNQK